MTWKSYAAVSGATVLAGWLASAPPSSAPRQAGSASAPRARETSPTPVDIEEQAMRLQAHARTERVFTEPQRNPFRFETTSPIARAPSEAAGTPTPERPELVDPVPPLVSVSGIAEDHVDGRIERTAVLSSPAGVLLVREGDEILDRYRVARIESEAVELIGLADGEPRRLTLGK